MQTNKEAPAPKSTSRVQRKFAAAHMDKPNVRWKNVFGQMRQTLIYLATITRGMFALKVRLLKNTVAALKHGGDSIMLWGSFAANGTDKFHKVSEIMKKGD